MDNGNDHRTAAKDVVFKIRAARDPVRIAIRPATAIGLQLRISAPAEPSRLISPSPTRRSVYQDIEFLA